MKFLIIVAVILNLILSSCVKHSEHSFYDLYHYAEKILKRKEYHKSIKKFEALNRKYPLHDYLINTKLYIIYAYYQMNHFTFSKKLAKDFEKMYPQSPNMDWIFYVQALVEIEMSKSTFQKFFNINLYNRDPTHIKNAFSILSKLLKKFPKTLYYNHIQKKIIYLKKYLSRYELLMARFYIERKAYVAVIHHVKKMIKHYPETIATKKALPIMLKAYRKLHLDKEAQMIEKFIKNQYY